MKNRTQIYNRENEKRKKKIHVIDKDAEEIILIFRDNMNRIKKRFDMVDYLIKQDKNEEAYDVLRFQIVYAMSTLDFFMHEIYNFGLIKIFRNENPKTYRYNEYKIPLKLLEKALYDAENLDEYLKQTFIDMNQFYTFMAPSRIREMLNIISSKDEFALAEKKLKDQKIISEHLRLDKILEHIYQRRNKIAHQTDIDHGTDDKNKITKQEVEYYYNVISHLGEALYQLVCLNKK